MSVITQVPAEEPVIVMSRVYDAPRDLVWEAITQPRHVAQWWGGPGFSNPVCEMDLRPGGHWRHVMRFPDGRELPMSFIFLEVEKPHRLVWQHADHGVRREGPPTCTITVTLEDMGRRTKWTMVARFDSLPARDAAIAVGFSKPIEASSDRLVEYLQQLSPGGVHEDLDAQHGG
jgi:uncharacterized protein YndB with AHSA1/START domain